MALERFLNKLGIELPEKKRTNLSKRAQDIFARSKRMERGAPGDPRTTQLDLEKVVFMVPQVNTQKSSKR